MGPFIGALTIGIVVAAVFLVIRGRPSAVIEIRSGRAVCVRGKVPTQFLTDCEQLLHAEPPLLAKIRIYRTPRQYTLRCSPEISPRHVQRLRNAWSARTA
ncbi:MAG: DUF3634 family protein [Planctomycetota bacterium]